MVTMDGLDGILDHSALLRALSGLADAGGSVGLVLFDIDGFAKVNEVGGRDSGDRVILEIAGGARKLADELEGTVYRVSGDEFYIVLPENSLEQAFLHAERFRKWVEGNQSAIAPPSGTRITVSVGVSHYPRNAKSPEDALRAASAAMFSAKENGRNQVALPLGEEMVMKSCYYPVVSVTLLKQLAARVGKTESELLREALDDLLRKYDD